MEGKKSLNISLHTPVSEHGGFCMWIILPRIACVVYFMKVLIIQLRGAGS